MTRSTLDPDNAGRRRRRKTDPQARPGAEQGFERGVSGNKAGLGGGLDQAEEARQIAENAYYRSEKRGFAPGQEAQDWLEAEAEIKSRRNKRP